MFCHATAKAESFFFFFFFFFFFRQAEQHPAKQQLIFVYTHGLGNIFNGVRKNTAHSM